MMRKDLLSLVAASLLCCVLAGLGSAEGNEAAKGRTDPGAEDVRALSARFYRDINVAKALLRGGELEKLREQDARLPLSRRLAAAGVSSARRRAEIEAAIVDAKRVDPAFDGRSERSGLAFERLSGGFELVKSARESGGGYEVELVLYSANEGPGDCDLRELLIRGLEAGRIDRKGILKGIDTERKMITGDRLDYWTRNGRTWTLSSSPIHEAS